MKIEFKQEDKEHIDIIGVDGKKRKVIGRIFTPSGSGEEYTNGIQICGFTEAFDLWGCACFGKEKVNKERLPFSNDEITSMLFGARTNDNRLKQLIRYFEEKKPESLYNQTKDIQLKFDFKVEPHQTEVEICGEDCCKCYNKPCTCENKVIFDNPYSVKRAQDLSLERVKDTPNLTPEDNKNIEESTRKEKIPRGNK